jgi:hypothetical protein
VSVELLSRREILESAEEVGRYRAAFNQVYERALSPEDSHNFLVNLAKEYGKLTHIAFGARNWRRCS